MNGVDLIILIILAIGFISGLARGIVRTLFGLAALVLGVVAADFNGDLDIDFVAGNFAEPNHLFLRPSM